MVYAITGTKMLKAGNMISYKCVVARSSLAAHTIICLGYWLYTLCVQRLL